MRLLDLGICVCGFLQTELSTVMDSCELTGTRTPRLPQELGGMLSALAASLHCVAALMVLMKICNHLTAFILLEQDSLNWRWHFPGSTSIFRSGG